MAHWHRRSNVAYDRMCREWNKNELPYQNIGWYCKFYKHGCFYDFFHAHCMWRVLSKHGNDEYFSNIHDFIWKRRKVFKNCFMWKDREKWGFFSTSVRTKKNPTKWKHRPSLSYLCSCKINCRTKNVVLHGMITISSFIHHERAPGSCNKIIYWFHPLLDLFSSKYQQSSDEKIIVKIELYMSYKSPKR